MNKVKFVARAARHSFKSSTIELMFGFFEVKGAEMEASDCDRESPMSACLRAAQSLAPSPHMDTCLSVC